MSSSSMHLPRRAVFVRGLGAICLCFLAAASVRCSVAEMDASDSGGLVDSGDPEPRPEVEIVIGGGMGGEDGGSASLDPLCGVGTCVPDSPQACDQGLGGAGGAGDGFGGVAGSLTYEPGDLDEVGVACQVSRLDECAGSSCVVERVCAPSGASREAEPCVSSSDCRPGLACVGDGVSGLCRPYCCKGTERSCSEGTFCDERSLLENPAVFVPVCLPVDDCPLTDPYPCPLGQTCACPADRACVVVRSDGATACTRPGSGQSGDDCVPTQTADCAHGFVCSGAGCIKLCSTAPPEPDDEPECEFGSACTSPPEFPINLGVCVRGDEGSTAAR